MAPRNEAYISLRVPQDVKAQLEQRAALENTNLPEYLRRHYYELIHSGTLSPGSPTSSTSDVITISNPGPQPYAAPFPTAAYYGSGAVPDAMDGLVNDLRKMLSVRMMTDLMRQYNDPYEVARYMANPRAIEQQRNDGGFKWEDYLKYQMMMQENDRRMAMAQQQLVLAREKGDKGGEQSAWQTIAALIAAQGTQSQNFMQQFMATAQANSQQQQAIFTTALQVKNQADQDAFQQSQQFQGRLDAARNELWAAQMASFNKINELTVNQLKMDMERIRTDKSKDTLGQISELLKLRSDPVYKAAFDAAFGIKDESMIGKLLPQLQAMGVDRIIENAGKWLAGLVMKPKVAIPEVGPPEMPTLQPQQPPRMIPAPSPLPLSQVQQPSDLTALRIPPYGTTVTANPTTETQQPTQSQPTESEKKSDDNIGYTNLTPYLPPAKKPDEIIVIPTPEPEPESSPIPVEEEGKEELQVVPPTIAEKPTTQQQLPAEKKKDESQSS